MEEKKRKYSRILIGIGFSFFPLVLYLWAQVPSSVSEGEKEKSEISSSKISLLQQQIHNLNTVLERLKSRQKEEEEHTSLLKRWSTPPADVSYQMLHKLGTPAFERTKAEEKDWIVPLLPSSSPIVISLPFLPPSFPPASFNPRYSVSGFSETWHEKSSASVPFAAPISSISRSETSPPEKPEKWPFWTQKASWEEHFTSLLSKVDRLMWTYQKPCVFVCFVRNPNDPQSNQRVFQPDVQAKGSFNSCEAVTVEKGATVSPLCHVAEQLRDRLRGTRQKLWVMKRNDPDDVARLIRQGEDDAQHLYQWMARFINGSDQDEAMQSPPCNSSMTSEKASQGVDPLLAQEVAHPSSHSIFSTLSESQRARLFQKLSRISLDVCSHESFSPQDRTPSRFDLKELPGHPILQEDFIQIIQREIQSETGSYSCLLQLLRGETPSCFHHMFPQSSLLNTILSSTCSSILERTPDVGRLLGSLGITQAFSALTVSHPFLFSIPDSLIQEGIQKMENFLNQREHLSSLPQPATFDIFWIDLLHRWQAVQGIIQQISLSLLKQYTTLLNSFSKFTQNSSAGEKDHSPCFLYLIHWYAVFLDEFQTHFTGQTHETFALIQKSMEESSLGMKGTVLRKEEASMPLIPDEFLLVEDALATLYFVQRFQSEWSQNYQTELDQDESARSMDCGFSKPFSQDLAAYCTSASLGGVSLAYALRFYLDRLSCYKKNPNEPVSALIQRVYHLSSDEFIPYFKPFPPMLLTPRGFDSLIQSMSRYVTNAYLGFLARYPLPDKGSLLAMWQKALDNGNALSALPIVKKAFEEYHSSLSEQKVKDMEQEIKRFASTEFLDYRLAYSFTSMFHITLPTWDPKTLASFFTGDRPLQGVFDQGKADSKSCSSPLALTQSKGMTQKPELPLSEQEMNQEMPPDKVSVELRQRVKSEWINKIATMWTAITNRYLTSPEAFTMLEAGFQGIQQYISNPQSWLVKRSQSGTNKERFTAALLQAVLGALGQLPKTDAWLLKNNYVLRYYLDNDFQDFFYQDVSSLLHLKPTPGLVSVQLPCTEVIKKALNQIGFLVLNPWTSSLSTYKTLLSRNNPKPLFYFLDGLMRFLFNSLLVEVDQGAPTQTDSDYCYGFVSIQPSNK